MKLVTVSQMLSIEEEADRVRVGLTYDQMLENAGQGPADVILDLFVDDVEPEAPGLAGPSNNGGNTLVGLTALAKAGWKVKAYLIKRKTQLDELVKELKDGGGEDGRIGTVSKSNEDFDVWEVVLKHQDFFVRSYEEKGGLDLRFLLKGLSAKRNRQVKV
jgi:NAD(P)H-hydrate repair Nnr-like enzyme with NAD(P)H-hydrate epimerase domain